MAVWAHRDDLVRDENLPGENEPARKEYVRVQVLVGKQPAVEVRLEKVEEAINEQTEVMRNLISRLAFLYHAMKNDPASSREELRRDDPASPGNELRRDDPASSGNELRRDSNNEKKIISGGSMRIIPMPN
jgi:hypothetical protein